MTDLAAVDDQYMPKPSSGQSLGEWFSEMADRIPGLTVPQATRALGVLCFVGGGLMTRLHFTPSDPWFFVGLWLLGVSALCLVAALLLSARTRIVRAFDIGFAAGVRKERMDKQKGRAVVSLRP